MTFILKDQPFSESSHATNGGGPKTTYAPPNLRFQASRIYDRTGYVDGVKVKKKNTVSACNPDLAMVEQPFTQNPAMVPIFDWQGPECSERSRHNLDMHSLRKPFSIQTEPGIRLDAGKFHLSDFSRYYVINPQSLFRRFLLP